MAIEEVVVPDIGGSEGAEVIELLVAVGDTVELEQGLVVLESDKASMEIPSTVAGKVVELQVAEGDQLVEGAPVVKIEVEGDAAAAAEPADDRAAPGGTADEPAAGAPDPEPEPEPARKGESKGKGKGKSDGKGKSEIRSESPPAYVATKARSAVASTATSGEGTYAGPAVRKLAREFGVPLDRVKGSGPQGRIVKEDLHQFVQRALGEGDASAGGAAIPPVPEQDFAAYGAVEVTQRSKLDKLTANNMHRSWLNVPHVTQTDEADITELEQFRRELKAEAEQRGVKLSPLPFILKACAVALRDNPQLNSSLANGGEELVFKKYFHIGMAVDTPAGLVVPVLRDVDQKTIWELAAEILTLAAKARERKLTPNEMRGGCFTVSSLGSIGGTGFTPIVNTPEVGILGVSKAAVKPVWDGAEFQPRTMLPLSLSYDHRVVNGGDGGRFLSQLVALLSDIRQLLM